MGKKRRSFSAEFKLEAAQLVVDQNYSAQEAANAMGVGLSTAYPIYSIDNLSQKNLIKYGLAILHTYGQAIVGHI